MDEGIDPLSFSIEWYSLGIVTEKKYQELLSLWTIGRDRNPEHYRWGAFCDFNTHNSHLPDDVVRRLYRLGENDPDWTMGGAIMAEVVLRKDCPQDIINEASQDTSRGHLVKIVQKRK